MVLVIGFKELFEFSYKSGVPALLMVLFVKIFLYMRDIPLTLLSPSYRSETVVDMLHVSNAASLDVILHA